jgi:hypothetical protein
MYSEDWEKFLNNVNDKCNQQYDTVLKTVSVENPNDLNKKWALIQTTIMEAAMETIKHKAVLLNRQ